MKARLQPPLAPLRPGSYDFGRDMFFQGIGASGFVTGAIKTIEPPVAGGLYLRYAAFMQGLRDAIDARIRTTLDGDKRAIAPFDVRSRRHGVEHRADLLDPASLRAIGEGYSTAYYLVHSMGRGGDANYEQRDASAA